MVECTDVSEEHTASIFRVTCLVRVGAELMRTKNVSVVEGSLREGKQDGLQAMVGSW